jgi:3-oxoadipate enol-lactonase
VAAVLAHDDTGTGPPVVLLHSGIADRRMWRDVVLVLSGSFRVVAPDLRGFGESAMPPAEFGDADDVAALLDRLGIEDAAVVGSSLGGRVALELASIHPGRVSSLVLLCPAFRGVPRRADALAFNEEEARLLEAGDIAGVVALNVGTFLGPEASEEARSFVAAMFRHAIDVQVDAESASAAPRRREVEVRLGDLDVPTVVVAGGHDLDHFRAVAQYLVRGIAGARLEPLAWAGHLPSLERPREIATWLRAVLSG